MMKRHLLSLAFAFSIAASVQAQNELDDLLKKQDAPPAASAAPNVLAASTPPGASQKKNPPPANPAWREYINQRFGFALSYPAELVASTAPTNGSGIECHTADNQFSIVARAQYMGVADPNDSLEKRWQDELKALGAAVMYKHKASTWYVISGTNKEGTEYYHKFLVQGKNWVDFSIAYPHADAKKYDKWVEEISKRFIPFLGGDYDRLK